MIHCRIMAPVVAKSDKFSEFKFSRAVSIRLSKFSCLRKTRNACEVVAKPLGTLTAVGICEIISPKLAFFPPTSSTSDIRKFSNGTTIAEELKRSDMQYSKNKKTKRSESLFLSSHWTCTEPQKHSFECR